MGQVRATLSRRHTLRRLASLAGARGINMLVTLLHGKITAMLLGTAGIGTTGLLTTSATTIQQAAGLGLNMSGVKEIAGDDTPGIHDTILTLRRLTLLTALLGAILTVILSPQISLLTFGHRQYSGEVCQMSLFILFATLSAGEFAILQGLHATTRLTRSSAIGAIVGLIPVWPLLATYGYKAIPAALVIAAATRYIALRIAAGSTPRGSRFSRKAARRLLRTGPVMMLSLMAAAGSAWITIALIRSMSSIDEAGLFQAAQASATRATEILFAALSIDFFPTLSTLGRTSRRLTLAVNRQTELVAYIATPISIAVILLASPIVSLLFSSEFHGCVTLLQWLAAGSLLKALSYPAGYIAFVKENPKAFILMEVIGANLIELSGFIIGFIIGSLQGAGIGYCVAQALTIVMYLTVNRRLYGFGYGPKAIRLSAAATAIVAATIATALLTR